MRSSVTAKPVIPGERGSGGFREKRILLLRHDLEFA